MTALAGFWRIDRSADPADACERMLKAQQVYAPASSSVVRTAGDIALGRRLFPTLPEDRHDRGPVAGHRGRSSLVADARIDNREALAAALGITASHASRLSDAALIMHVLEQWGEGGISRLRGDFALAWWDGDSERLVLARDYLGQRPLHLHRGAGFFAFSSMPAGLHGIPEIPLQPDDAAIAAFLALLPQTGSGTFFAGIERVPPGHLCVVTRHRLTYRRYWEPPSSPLRLRDATAYEEAVRESLDRAVRARLRGAEQGVGAHLSGGLDSSAVAATAARLLGPAGRLAVFTAVPGRGYSERVQRGRFADEGPLAAEVAALYPNMEHVLIRSGGRSPLANLDRHAFLYGRPVLNLANAVWLDAILDAARERRLKVMLTGQRGNMSFSYAGLEALPELLAGGRWLRLAKLAVQLRAHGTRFRSVAAHAFGPFLPVPLWTAINRLRGRQMTLGHYSALGPSRGELLREPARQAGLDFSYRPRRDPLGTRLWALGRTDHGNYNKGQLAGWGVDVRDPTADQDLVELCLAIPPEQYLAGGLSRSLARRAFADRLPPAILAETRKGYQAADWHEGLAAAWSEAAEEVERLASLPSADGLFDTAKLRRLLAAPPDGDWNRPGVVSAYRLSLLRAISAGDFLRRASGAN